MYLYIEKQFDGPSQYMKRRINIDTWKERERERVIEREIKGELSTSSRIDIDR